MVAPNYAAQRTKLAKQIGVGQIQTRPGPKAGGNRRRSNPDPSSTPNSSKVIAAEAMAWQP
jgi:hypothetical protein